MSRDTAFPTRSHVHQAMTQPAQISFAERQAILLEMLCPGSNFLISFYLFNWCSDSRSLLPQLRWIRRFENKMF